MNHWRVSAFSTTKFQCRINNTYNDILHFAGATGVPILTIPEEEHSNQKRSVVQADSPPHQRDEMTNYTEVEKLADVKQNQIPSANQVIIFGYYSIILYCIPVFGYFSLTVMFLGNK